MNAKTKRFSFVALMAILVICALLAFGFMPVSADTRVASVSDLESSTYYKNGGAAVRTDDPVGIRFFVLVEKNVYDQILTDGNGNVKDGVSTGTLIIPTDVLGNAELTRETAKTTDTDTTDRWTEYTEDANYMQSVVYLWDIPTESYNRNISYRGYVIIDGQTYYTQDVAGTERSPARVMLKAFKEDGTGNDKLLAGVQEIVGKTMAISVAKDGTVTRLNDVDENLNFIYNENSKYTVENNFTVVQTGAKLEITFTTDVQALEVQLANGLEYGVTADETGKYARKVTVQGVDKPQVTASALGDVDLSNNVMTLSLTDDLGLSANDASAVTTAPQVKVGNVSASNVELNAGELTVSFETNSKPWGEQTMAVEFDNYIVEADGLFITKIITTASDLVNLQTLAGGRDANDAYGGYFVLGNSIDLGSTSMCAINDNNNHYRDNTHGFQGVFDGKGHVIANGIYGVGGLFGTVGKNGIVKNVAFYNSLVAPSASTGAGIMGYKFFGLLENVYVDNTVNTGSDNVAPISYSVYGATFKNIVVETDYVWSRMAVLANHGAFVAFNASAGHGASEPGLKNVYENVYVITNRTYKGEVSLFDKVNTQTYDESGNGLVAYLDTETNMTFSGLSDIYWDLNGIPQFKSIENELTATYSVEHYVLTANSWQLKETEVKRAIVGSSITTYGKGYMDRKFMNNSNNSNDLSVLPSDAKNVGTVTAENDLLLKCYYKMKDQYLVYSDISSALVLEMRGSPRNGNQVITYHNTFEGVNDVWQMTSAPGGDSRIVLKTAVISLATLQGYKYFDIKVYSSNWSTIDVIPQPSSGAAYNVQGNKLLTDKCVSLYNEEGTEKLTTVPTSGWATLRFDTSALGNSTYMLQLGLTGSTTTSYYFAQPTLVK